MPRESFLCGKWSGKARHMQHRIEAEKLGAEGPAMLEAIEACVHCGFCLPACPTYESLGEEMDSPRGRIFLMKEVLEGGLSLSEAAPYVDRCLGCLACEPACPSGVEYGSLLAPFRSMSAGEGTGSQYGRRRRTHRAPCPGPISAGLASRRACV